MIRWHEGTPGKPCWTCSSLNSSVLKFLNSSKLSKNPCYGHWFIYKDMYLPWYFPKKDQGISGNFRDIAWVRCILVVPLTWFVGVTWTGRTANATVSRRGTVAVHRKIWGVPEHGDTKNGWLIREKISLKWMIWGYPYFRKPPDFGWVFLCVCMLQRSGRPTAPSGMCW